MLEQLGGYLNDGLSLNNLGILMALVALETTLSADNAIALAALVQPLDNQQHQRQALNWGLVAAFGLRIVLLLIATWAVQFWQFALAGALYLLGLVIQYFWKRFWVPAENTEFSDCGCCSRYYYRAMLRLSGRYLSWWWDSLPGDFLNEVCQRRWWTEKMRMLTSIEEQSLERGGEMARGGLRSQSFQCDRAEEHIAPVIGWQDDKFS